MVEEAKFKGVYGEWIGGPCDGLPAKLNGLYQGLVVVLVCDYSGRFGHIRPDNLGKYFKPNLILMESIGDQIISEIVKRGMLTVSHPDPDAAHVFVWSSGAAEQLDALVAQKLKDITRTIYDAQDMLTAAMTRGESDGLHSTAHAVRDNLRTVLAQLGR